MKMFVCKAYTCLSTSLKKEDSFYESMYLEIQYVTSLRNTKLIIRQKVFQMKIRMYRTRSILKHQKLYEEIVKIKRVKVRKYF